MSRMTIDCRTIPSGSGCSLTISGEADEVVRVAAMHAVQAHGYQDNDKLRKGLRDNLRDERTVP